MAGPINPPTEYGICQIVRGNHVIGLGFAIAPDLVATCAHVVNATLNRLERELERPERTDIVPLRFPIGSDAPDAGQTASVIAWLPHPTAAFEANDIAVLKLDTPAPAHVPSLQRGTYRRREQVQLWGPSPTRPDGGHVSGQLMGEVIGGRIQLNVNDGPFRVRRGFSGGPIWNIDNDRVVGILAACGVDDIGDAYLLDASKIQLAWPEWGQQTDSAPDGGAVDAADRNAGIAPAAAQPAPRIVPVHTSTQDQPWRRIDPDPGAEGEALAPVKALSAHPDQRVIAVANGRRRAIVYDFSGRFARVSLQIADPDEGPFNTINFNDIRFDATGDAVIASHLCSDLLHETERTEIRRANDGSELVSIPRGGYGGALSGDSTLLAVRDSQKRVSIWNLDNRQLGEIRHKAVTALAFSPVPNEAILATGGDDARARIWDAGSSQQVLECAHPDAVTAVAFSPDAAWLATGCADGKARVWSDAGAQMLEFPHDGAVNAVAFSPDGRWLASAGQDNAAKIWDVATGQLTMTCSHTAPVTALAFGADDETWLATGGHDGSVRIWLMPTAPG